MFGDDEKHKSFHFEIFEKFRKIFKNFGKVRKNFEIFFRRLKNFQMLPGHVENVWR